MKMIQKIAAGIARSAAEQALKRDAARTSCGAFYQPKAPHKLKSFRKNRK